MTHSGRRVVVTGIGLVTPLGIGVKDNWSNLLAGKSSTKSLDPEYKSLPCQVAAQVAKSEFNEHLLKNGILKNSDIKSMSLANMFAVAAADEAVRDSGWTAADERDEWRAGTSVATGMAGLIEIAEAATALGKDQARGFKTMSPYFVPKILANLSSGLVSIRHKLKVKLAFFIS
jgi:3-oxoacyl-[acyl-carrier-protein] synthase II